MDHITPLKRGGADVPSNMQWQTIDAAKAKDLWEWTGAGLRAACIGNTPAQRAYEGAGFAVADEKRDPEFEATFGAPGTRRLMRS